MKLPLLRLVAPTVLSLVFSASANAAVTPAALKLCAEMTAAEHETIGYECQTANGGKFVKVDYRPFGTTGSWMDPDGFIWSGVTYQQTSAHDAQKVCDKFGAYLPDSSDMQRLIQHFAKRSSPAVRLNQIDWESYSSIFSFSYRHAFWLKGEAGSTQGTLFSSPAAAHQLTGKKLRPKDTVSHVFSSERMENIHGVRCVARSPAPLPAKDRPSGLTDQALNELRKNRCQGSNNELPGLLKHIARLYEQKKYIIRPYRELKPHGLNCVYNPYSVGAHFFEMKATVSGEIFRQDGADFKLDPSHPWVYWTDDSLGYRSPNRSENEGIRGDAVFFKLQPGVYLIGNFTNSSPRDSNAETAIRNPSFYAVSIYFDGE